MSDSRRNVITSEELSKSLDNDYSEDKLKKRIQFNKKYLTSCLRHTNILNNSFLVGSKAEGIANFLESDMDIMFVENKIICTENVERLAHEFNQVFKLDRTDAPAGYCYLYSPDTNTKISSWWDILEENQSISGPARTSCLNDRCTSYRFQDDFEKIFDNCVNISIDQVLALPCELPDLRTAWCKRSRKYDWPSQETIQHVDTLPAHVVKVGLKGSDDQEHQWRMCFTLAELHLMQSLNNTQTKVYVCLKRIAKYYLKPIDDTVTSYIIKNLVLWLAESMPLEKFNPKHLIERIEDGLRFLKTSVQDKYLQNYMIPKRNLFVNKLENNEPLLEAINKILPLKLYRSELIMSPEVRMLYEHLCEVEKCTPLLIDNSIVEQILEVVRSSEALVYIGQTSVRHSK